MTRPLIKNPRLGSYLGGAFVVAGLILLHDAYDKRGRAKPFLLKFLPGA